MGEKGFRVMDFERERKKETRIVWKRATTGNNSNIYAKHLIWVKVGFSNPNAIQKLK